jgi:hypothetical protein
MTKKYDESWEYEDGIFTAGGKHVYSVSLTAQDLADMLSFAHAEKVKKDNEIRKQYETQSSNNQSTQEPR